jgi:hypothetical protein
MDLFAVQKALNAIPANSGPKFTGANQVGNFKAFRKVVNQLAMIQPLARFAQEIQTLSIFASKADTFQTDPNVVTELKQRTDALFAAADALKQILDTTLPEVPPETIIITLSSQKELTTTTNFLEEFQKALAPLVFEPGIDGKLEVIHWQSGSLVVLIFVGSMTAIGLIARTLQAAAMAYQEVQKGRATAVHVDLLKEHVREARIKNELANVLAEAQKERIKPSWTGNPEP